ncbi:hypothetical protein GCM10023201_33500 [Actinomycetospora corticicola]|uniref:Uncharacterized protein n=1 Tax=Actinomycetospora corticicola TaxID=663602 RepID=A0A7Y9DS70_9PSEU|nr:hypothetical protein [Actinomycetospora corticicola]NYD34526.1 hypothetical protein [Actinomycetospora corticicola]
MGTIAIDDVERGDILLVTKNPHSALAQMIVDLDRSPGGFSHSGIAGGKNTIISAFPTGIEPAWPVAVTGLTYEPFSHFWSKGQEIYRLVPPPGVDRDAALTRLDSYPESRKTRFGVASIVLVAAALHAMRDEYKIGEAGADAVVRSAIRAGQVWSSDDEFFCAEFSAVIYDLDSRPFTVADLRPPLDIDGEGIVTDIVIKIGLELLLAERTPEQKETLRHFVATVRENDPRFFEDGIDVLGKEILSVVGLAKAADLPDDTPVPSTLITPRMLEAWGEGTEWIRH